MLDSRKTVNNWSIFKDNLTFFAGKSQHEKSSVPANCFQYLDCLQNEKDHVSDSFTGNAFCQQRKYLNL